MAKQRRARGPSVVRARAAAEVASGAIKGGAAPAGSVSPDGIVERCAPRGTWPAFRSAANPKMSRFVTPDAPKRCLFSKSGVQGLTVFLATEELKPNGEFVLTPQDLRRGEF